MTQDEIIEMAKQAGFWKEYTDTWMCNSQDIEVFAKLVAETERDECAMVCADIGIEARKLWKSRYETHDDGRSDGAFECVEAIRARGQE